MKEILRFFVDDQYYDVDLTDKKNITIGNNKKCDVQINLLSASKKYISYAKTKKGPIIKFFIPTIYKGKTISEISPTDADVYRFDKNGNEYVKVITLKQQNNKSLDLSNVSELAIGRDPKSQIVLRDNNVSRKHALLIKIGSTWCLKDMGSTNGIYLNKRKVNDEYIHDGDEITISEYTIVINNNKLSIIGDKDIVLNLKSKKRDNLWEYPVFSRSPRIKNIVQPVQLEIQPPPQIGSKPSISWLSVLLPPIGMTAATVIMSLVMNSKSMFFMLPMTLISVIVSVINYKNQINRFKNEEALRLEKYNEHIEKIKKDAQNNVSQYHEEMNTRYPLVSEYIEFAKNLNPRLWERQPSDNDFMSIRVGTGVLPANFQIQIPAEKIELYEDELKQIPKKTAEEYKTVTDMPITVDLNSKPICGIKGDREKAIRLVKNIIVGAASAHAYTDLKISIIFNKNESEDWLWTRWLPHVFDNERSERYLADSKESAEDLMKKMSEIFDDRFKKADDNYFGRSVAGLPFYLFVIADLGMANGIPGMKYLLSADGTKNIAAIFIAGPNETLPQECMNIIDVDVNDEGIIINTENASEKHEFTIENISNTNYDNFAKYIAPVRLRIANEESKLPGVITFFEGYGIDNLYDIDLTSNWGRIPRSDNMSVPIGIRGNGDQFFFNIKTQGPHGLVAGMTGSGKSEMVQSWILSMSLAFSPENVSFILIDFKGSGLLLPFKNLPHLAGKISDMDKTVARNMIAIDSEIQRRKKLFDNAGVQNIDDYIKKTQDDDSLEKLSYLFVIIDEFAELKVKFPEFMELINSIFGIGRTLGIFIILMSQKPTGVISDKMRANSNFSWCLKVKEASDSKEMLQRSDAVKIVNPGRAYVKVGEFEVYEMIQSFWSGAPYIPDKSDDFKVVPQISTMNLRGERKSYAIKPIDEHKESGKKEIEVLVDYIANESERLKFKTARKIWVDRLEETIYLDDIINNENNDGLTAVVGMVDAPELQSQFPLKLKMDECGHIVLYGAPGTGKTTFLKSYIMSLMVKYTPQLVNIYIMDFGGMQMGVFKDYPFIGGIAYSDDSEKIKKLTGMILKELKSRQALFAHAGVANLKAYNEVSQNSPLPYIILAVDNYDPVLQIYPELEDFFIKLTHDGGGYGIYFVATATNINALGYKMRQNIKTSLTLRLVDRSDYINVVGRTEGMEPENLLGRGLINQGRIHEFQAALPAKAKGERERSALISELGKKMSAECAGKRAKQIPIMPETISYGSVTGDGVLLGLSVEEIEPVSIDFGNTFLATVSSRKREARSNILTVIANQIKSVYKNAVVAIADTDNLVPNIQESVDRYLIDAGSIDNFMEELIPELQKRQQSKQADSSIDFEPIFMLISSWKNCYEIISDITAKRFDSIARLGEGLNVNIILCADNNEMASMYHQGETLTNTAVLNGYGILLGGSLNDHTIYDTSDIPFTKRNDILAADYGYFCHNGKTIMFKNMKKD